MNAMIIGENTASCEPVPKAILRRGGTSSIIRVFRGLLLGFAIWSLTITALLCQELKRYSLTRRDVQNMVSHIHQLEDRGNLNEALVESKRFAETVEKFYGPAHVATAFAKREFAEAYMLRSDFGHPVELLRESLQVFSSGPQIFESQVALTRMDLGRCYAQIGQLAEAERLDGEALDYFTKNGDAKDASTVRANFARLLAREGKFQDAISLNEQELQTRIKLYPADDPHISAIRYELGVDFATLKKMPAAESSLRQVLSAGDKFNSALVMRTLGYVLLEEGKFDDAEKLLLQARNLDIQTLGRPSNEAFYLAMLYAHTGRWDEAAQTIDGRVRWPQLLSAISSLSESEQLSFLQDYLFEVQAALSFGLARPDDSKIGTASTGWLLMNKGLPYQALAERTLLARDSSDPAVAQTASELQAVRERLSKLANTAAPTQEDAVAKKQFEGLLHQEADLSRRLGHLEYRPPEAGRSVELNDVRAAIPSDAMLFEFARVEAEDWNDQGGPNGAKPVQRYGVWIIPPEGQGDVQVVDLGEAKQIDSEIEKVRAIFGKFDLQVDSEEERELEQQYRETVGTLTDLVLRPLEMRGARARRWILSPDGQLWLIPWPALPTTHGTSLVENRIISYVISGRDLLSREHPPQKLAPPVIMADPNYDLSPSDAATNTRKLIAELQKDLGPSDLLLARSGTGDGSEPIKRSAPANKALRLPLTRNEAKAIFPYLQIYAKAEPLLFLDNDALKGVFKSIRHPHAVVLSTHGEFATAQDMGVDESHLKPGAGFLLENPLLRCHLLLAGCNQRSPPSEDVDDGVLTGAEIVGCDLRGTDLVVLSACKTGLGDIHAGLSAAGLRQAFQLAGAQTVVASLWSVPDVETATLMEAFFKNLAGGASKAAALCEAQRDLIKARRAARRGAAHPYFWAAFTLTGPP